MNYQLLIFNITKIKKFGPATVVALHQLVPGDHLVRKIEAATDFDFIYPLVEDRYSTNNVRPSVDPAVLIKMMLVQYLFGIRSMH